MFSGIRTRALPYSRSTHYIMYRRWHAFYVLRTDNRSLFIFGIIFPMYFSPVPCSKIVGPCAQSPITHPSSPLARKLLAKLMLAKKMFHCMRQILSSAKRPRKALLPRAYSATSVVCGLIKPYLRTRPPRAIHRFRLSRASVRMEPISCSPRNPMTRAASGTLG